MKRKVAALVALPFLAFSSLTFAQNPSFEEVNGPAEPVMLSLAQMDSVAAGTYNRNSIGDLFQFHVGNSRINILNNVGRIGSPDIVVNVAVINQTAIAIGLAPIASNLANVMNLNLLSGLRP